MVSHTLPKVDLKHLVTLVDALRSAGRKRCATVWAHVVHAVRLVRVDAAAAERVTTVELVRIGDVLQAYPAVRHRKRRHEKNK